MWSTRRLNDMDPTPRPATPPERRDTRSLMTHHYPDPALQSHPGAEARRRRLYLVVSLGTT